MWEAIRNSFKIPELRSRIIFTFLMLAVFRFGVYIPVPGISLSSWANFFNGVSAGAGGGFFTLLNAFAGGALSNMSIFAMSVTPYINASIILQLLMAVVPSLKELAKEGEQGRQKIEKYTRELTLLLAAVEALALTIVVVMPHATPGLNKVAFIILSSVSLMAGSMFLQWIGEMITDKGIGNGISIIIFAGVVATYPFYLGQMIISNLSVTSWALFFLIFVVTIFGLIYIMQGERRINVQYAKKVVGRKMYGGQSSYIPMKVNQGGVLPIIFAVAILMIPSMIAQFTHNYTLQSIFGFNSVFYIVIYALLVFFFTYFYSAITFDVHDVSDNIKEYGGFIPGIRPGVSTEQYLAKVLSRITFLGALALVVIALLPNISAAIVGSNSGQIVGGVGMMIAVGVALDVVQQMEAHLIMRHYEGFIKRGKLKGRI